ncbi:inorganic phosphate transporter [Paracoccus rhizosphaerae]|uniref:Phosphate transporter n=1 Tax=Paracoccus rhizosphaerae TaxID=1133347 RepID=A0ABV6CJM3_9RHOB|nr:inorganic phosphate transporter [Paracoccus rhizosphaerae]
MPHKTDGAGFHTLHKDLDRLSHAEIAQMHAFRPVWRLGLTVLGVVGALMLVLALSGASPGLLAVGSGLVVAAWLGMAIGANDVANSLGPAVGAGAIRLVPGLALVAVAGIAGAVLAGDAVSERLAGGIVRLAPLAGGTRASMAMLAALVGAASWITLATGIGLPVSTSHSIVGGITGAGAVTLGIGGVDWAMVAMIASVWVATPVLAGGIAAGVLVLLRTRVVEAADRGAAALRWLPPMVALMCGLFVAYVVLLLAGTTSFIALEIAAAAAAAVAGFMVTRRRVLRELAEHPRKPSIKRLLRPALLAGVVMLGFAHGANDVGNIAGPLSVILQGRIATSAGLVPALVLAAGGLAIATGTLFFGRRLVNMVGSGITKLNTGRAFCVTLATAVTVLGASHLGLPVSTTHVAVGGVFGVGFAREWLDRRRNRQAQDMPAEETQRRVLVRRSHVMTITLAWLVTLPITATLGALTCALVLWSTGV